MQWRRLNPRLDATMMNLAWWAPGKVNEAQWEISSSPPVCWRDAGGVGGVGDNRAWLSPASRGIAAHTGSIKAWPNLLVKLQKWESSKANRRLKMAGEIWPGDGYSQIKKLRCSILTYVHSWMYKSWSLNKIKVVIVLHFLPPEVFHVNRVFSENTGHLWNLYWVCIFI